MPLLLLFVLIIFSSQSEAYPEFIGYKYASCLTCHFNGLGNGPLNDYGRALWAAEIGGRLFAGKRSDEQLGEAAGILGSKQLPWWIRPGVKARTLTVETSPGSEQKQSRFILMQAEVNSAFFLDQDQTKTFVVSLGYVPIPNRLATNPSAQKPPELISREHYFRWQMNPNWWLYAGMTDKAYGIRIINHTAYSRARTGLAQNDQAHGVIVHYIQPSWEWAFNLFAGNLFQDADLRQAGISTNIDYDLRTDWRVGLSLLASQNEYIRYQRAGIHSRAGYGHGSAILFELGLLNDQPANSEARLGYYLFSEAIQRMWRGWHLFVSGQAYKEHMTDGYPDFVKAGGGFLIFPMQRLEFRLEFENTRKLSTQEIEPDGFLIMTQVHLSL